MRVPHSGQKAHTTGRPLSELRVYVLSSPCSTRTASRGMTMLIPKALPDCRWHSPQWQTLTAIGSAVSSYRTAPHWQPP
jgi:hypothetical protein